MATPLPDHLLSTLFHPMNNHQLTRRRFLQSSAALGAGALLLPNASWAAAATPAIPRRKYGNTGVDVSALGFGCMFDISESVFLLEQALQRGVTYWDTAVNYGNGRSEQGIGSFLEKNSTRRKEIFLVTKASRARSPEDMTRLLAQSLERLKTDYVDMYFLHGIDNVGRLTPDVKAWVEATKKSGKIRFFGFSAHSNMERTLSAASKLGWIDGAMITCNYRSLDKPEMKSALEAAYNGGMGVTAMKTQAERQGHDSTSEAALLKTFDGKGFTAGQAKLKAVMDYPHIHVACVQMPNLNVFRQNVAAAMNQATLTPAQKMALQRHAEATCHAYCAGCSHRCESALAAEVPVRDVMRHLMYQDHYPELDARELHLELAPEVRARLAQLDYTAAERACPNRLPIGALMRDAAARFA
jgi:predicted aldo/keto reductase-like oxidoreductase